MISDAPNCGFTYDRNMLIIEATGKDVKLLTEHDEVRRLPVHVLGIEAAVEQFGVAAAAVDVLLVLDGELDDQRLVPVGEGLELGGRGVKLGVLEPKVSNFSFFAAGTNKLVCLSLPRLLNPD
jgi:hypothetical protein